MRNKGFADNKTNIETPNDGVIVAEKPLKNGGMRPNRVDINVLKSKLQETESKEFKKNLFILTPGIRLPGDKKNWDQARVNTPNSAFKAGASAIVLGRSLVSGNLKKY